MGGVVNGMTLSHVRGYGSTFLVFADYMRAPIRLSAIMELASVWVFTHDSIGVGEDGPTHQPIEHLATLRAIPGSTRSVRAMPTRSPTAGAPRWRTPAAPTALIFSRQALPTLDRSKYASAEGTLKGGYVLADCEGTPEVILIATGSELSLVVQAHEKLSADGIKSRVVSMPSWYRYELQSEDYKESVLPSSVPSRLAVEQAGEMGWHRYVGLKGVRSPCRRSAPPPPYRSCRTNTASPSTMSSRWRAKCWRATMGKLND